MSSLQRALEAKGTPAAPAEKAVALEGSSGPKSDPSRKKPSEEANVQLAPPRGTFAEAQRHTASVALVGSADFHDPDSPALCDAIGREMARTPFFRRGGGGGDDACCLWTGANAVIPHRIARAYWEEFDRPSSSSSPVRPHVYHLAPVGYDCDWDFGRIVTAGRDMAERRRLLATRATAVLALEGGPGAADELRSAVGAGVSVVPVVRTGGAAAGMFGAPPTDDVTTRPPTVRPDDWEVVVSPGSGNAREGQTSEDAIRTCAGAVVRVLQQICENRVAQNSKSESAEGQQCGRLTFDYVEPTLARCAHLIVHANDDDLPSYSRKNVSLGKLFLGPKRAAREREALAAAAVAGIVNCTNRVPCHFRDATADGGDGNKRIKYCVVSVNDEDGADILSFLDGATVFVDAILSAGQNVLVHCEFGVSRSATVVIAYLIRYHGMSCDEAYVYVKKRRPTVHPNEGFLRQLRRFEGRWCGSDAESTDQAVVDSTSAVEIQNDISDEDAMNLDWCYTSCVLFSTLKDLPHVLKERDCFEMLLETTISLKKMEHYASVWLDFVWGRGVIAADLEWLAHCCKIVDGAISLAPLSAGDRPPRLPSMREVIFSVLRDEDSDFGSSWACEIYPEQVQKVVGMLTKEES